MSKQDAEALFQKGNALFLRGQNKKAIEIFDDVVARFGAARELGIRECVASALNEKALACTPAHINLNTAKGKREYRRSVRKQIAIFDDMFARFRSAPEPALRKWVAFALIMKGGALNQLRRYEETIRTLDKVVSRFASDAALRSEVCDALVRKGLAFGLMKKPKRAIAVYDALVARFGTASNPQVRREVGAALAYKCGRLVVLGRYLEAADAADDAVARFRAAGKATLPIDIPGALLGKCEALMALKRYEDVIAVCEVVIKSCRRAKDVMLKRLVAQARQLILSARASQKKNRMAVK